MPELTVDQLVQEIWANQPQDPAPPDLNGRVRSELEAVLAQEEGIQLLQRALANRSETNHAEEEGEDEAEQSARMGGIASFVTALDGAAGQGIPWSSAAVGLSAAFFTSEAIDAFKPPKNVDATTGAESVNFVNVLLKGGAAWVVFEYAPPYIGRTAALLWGSSLIFTIAVQQTPLQQWLQDWAAKLTGNFTGGQRRAASGQTVVNRQPRVTTRQRALTAGQVVQGQVLPGFGGASPDPLSSALSPN